MSYRITQTKWDTGERYCMLLDAETLPCRPAMGIDPGRKGVW